MFKRRINDFGEKLLIIQKEFDGFSVTNERPDLLALDTDGNLAFFNSLAYIDSHKKDLGIQYFPQIIEYLVEFIMKGLTNIRK